MLRLRSPCCRSRQTVDTRIVANKGGKKTDIKKLGMSSIKEGNVKNNLMGVSKYMDKKGWVDAQGNKGKVGTRIDHTIVGLTT